MLAPLALPHVESDFYYGPPRETFYSRTDGYKPRYEDVAHLIESGRHLHVFADWEATDKDRATAQPTQFGAVVFDLNMRLIARLDLRMAVGDLHPMAIQAALVARTWPEDTKKGWPGYIGMGIYRDLLESASHLDGRTLGLEARAFEDGTEGFIYPLAFPDHPMELEIKATGDQFRLVGEKLKRKKGDTWGRKLYSETHFFNGDGYDVNLAAHTAARYNMASLFHATRLAHAAIHVDPLAVARWIWAFGPQGSEGLQVLPRYHFKTRRNILSFKQDDILKANSPAAYRAIGRTGGVRLYDGSEYDSERAHGALPDSIGTAALYVLLRQIDPDGMRFVEMMAGEKRQKAFLQGNQNFGDRPLVGFVHYDEGMISRGIGFLIETGDTYGQERKTEVVVFNACYDPEVVSQWTDSELKANLIQKHNPVAVIYRTNRTAQFCEFERAHKAGAGINLTPTKDVAAGEKLTVEQLNKRRQWLINHRHTMNRIMSVMGELRTNSRQPNIVATRQPEEEAFDHYGDLKRIAKAKRDEPVDIYSRFQKKWDTTRRFDTILRKVMETHAVEYSDDPAALTDYVDRYKKLLKALDKIQKKWINPAVLPENFPTTNEEAVQHLWNLRVALHDHLFNYLPERFVQDEHGINLSIEKAMQVPYDIRRKRWQPEDRAKGAYWKCVFERNDDLSTTRMLDMAFDEADPFYRNHPSPTLRAWWKDFYHAEFAAARDWYDARVALKTQGPPNLEPSKHPSMTVARSAYETTHLRNTAVKGKGSDYERFVSNTPQGAQIITAWEVEQARRLRTQWLTPERKETVGYDPVTNFPILNSFFHVPRENTVRLVVPDSMLDEPLWHEQLQHHIIVARPERIKLQRALHDLGKDHQPVILEGAATGRERLAAKAFCSSLPRTAYGIEAAKKAESAYATIGGRLGAHPFVLQCEQLAPIHGKYRVDESLQRVTLPALDWAGLVSGQAGHLPDPQKTLMGLLVRDTGQKFQKGAVRLCRMHQGEVSGDEYQGSLAEAKLITVDDLLKMGDAEAQRFGKGTGADLVSEWRRTFSDLNIRDRAQQKIWMLRLAKPVDKATYVHFKPDAFPVAVYTGRPMRPVRKPKLKNRNLRRASA